MKQNRFKLWMQAVDNELLEEAQKPYRRKYTFIYRIGAMAACLVLVITAVTLTQRKKAESLQMPNPVTSASAEEIQHLGYSVPLPKDAENTTSLIWGRIPQKWQKWILNRTEQSIPAAH